MLSEEPTMPLIKDFETTPFLSTALWHIVEDSDVLARQLPLNEQQRHALQLRQSEGSRKGFLAARKALSSLGVETRELSHCNQGAPLLPRQYCSLSHCKTFALATLSDIPVGADIEAYRSKISRIASKFVHAQERSFLGVAPSVEMLTRLWTAKEAIYKNFRIAGLSFAQHITLAPFSMQDTRGTAKVAFSGNLHSVTLHFQSFHDHEISYATRNNTYASIH